jgi:hypothetical protein
VESQKGECPLWREIVYPVLDGWVGDGPVEQVCGATHWINVGVATVVFSLPAWCRGSSCRPLENSGIAKRGVPRPWRENVYPVLGGWVGDEPVEQVFYVGGATHWINVGVATVVCSLPAWCRGSS